MRRAMKKYEKYWVAVLSFAIAILASIFIESQIDLLDGEKSAEDGNYGFNSFQGSFSTPTGAEVTFVIHSSTVYASSNDNTENQPGLELSLQIEDGQKFVAEDITTDYDFDTQPPRQYIVSIDCDNDQEPIDETSNDFQKCSPHQVVGGIVDFTIIAFRRTECVASMKAQCDETGPRIIASAYMRKSLLSIVVEKLAGLSA